MEAEEEEEDEMARKLLHGFTVSFYFLFFIFPRSFVGWLVGSFVCWLVWLWIASGNSFRERYKTI